MKLSPTPLLPVIIENQPLASSCRKKSEANSLRKESNEGFLELALDRVLAVLSLRVGKMHGVHRNHVVQPPRARGRHLHLRRVVEASLELEGVAVARVAAEALEAGHDENFEVVQSGGEQPGS